MFGSYLPYQAALGIGERAGLLCTLRERRKSWLEVNDVGQYVWSDLSSFWRQFERTVMKHRLNTARTCCFTARLLSFDMHWLGKRTCPSRHPIHYYYWSLLYNAILRSRADSLRSQVILHEWIAFYSAFVEYPPKWWTYSAGMAGATWNCCHLGAFCAHHTTMHHVTSCKATYVRCMRV